MALTQIKPDALNWVEAWRIGRQPEQAQIAGNAEFGTGVPSGAINDDDGVFVIGQGSGKLPEEQVHGSRRDHGQHQTEIAACGGFHGGEHIGIGMALIDEPRWSLATQPPSTANPSFLTKPGFVLEE